ncbi:MAG: DNA methyltransferase, partial [Planctomycetota bacterium]
MFAGTPGYHDQESRGLMTKRLHPISSTQERMCMPHGRTPMYLTQLGAAYHGDSLDLLDALDDGSVNLVLTSPPFALQRQKDYGNKTGAEYIDWLTNFAKLVYRKLADDGSFVLDLGGAYDKGLPTRSLYTFRVAIKFCDEIGFHLA